MDGRQIPGPQMTRRTRQPSTFSEPGLMDSVSRSFGYSNYEGESDDYDMVSAANTLEAQRLINNRRFGFRKWKSHVSTRPLSERSEVVRSLYTPSYEPVRATTFTLGNICYVLLVGWWVALVYAAVAGIMYASVVSKRYGAFCLMMAKYFIWPFGKYIHWNSHTYMNLDLLQHRLDEAEKKSISLSHDDETEPIIRPSDTVRSYSGVQNHTRYSADVEDNVAESDDVMTHARGGADTAAVDIEDDDGEQGGSAGTPRLTKLNYRSAEVIVWLVFGVPFLGLMHIIAFLFTWLPVLSIPIAKINGRALSKFMLLPPDALRVEDNSVGVSESTSDIVLYVHQAVNVYYYKYTVDGMNVILVNMLSIVLVALVVGYADSSHKFIDQEAKFGLALISIIPLAYYIGMAITSLSAQTLPAIGALLNATFGSIVEIILYISSLVKERKEGTVCYVYLVKASLVGTLLATTLLIPGLSMVVGGLKHSTQRFNSHSTAVSATLLFVSIATVFAPSIFSSGYRTSRCVRCVNTTWAPVTNTSWEMDCSMCVSQDVETFAHSHLYRKYVEPLVFACVILLFIAYIIGLVFSLKTHKVHVYDSFIPDVIDGAPSGGHGGHAAPQWGRIKSIVILLVGTVVMCVCADLLVYNIEPILKNTPVSINFIGVLFLAIVPDIPEIVIGIQFALQNSITMSIEVGCNIATQVCMVQIPVLVLINLVYDISFHMLFNEIHIWCAAIAVFLMNYTYQDGKSNYFQGSALVIAYVAFICMYYFTPDPANLQC